MISSLLASFCQLILKGTNPGNKCVSVSKINFVWYVHNLTTKKSSYIPLMHASYLELLSRETKKKKNSSFLSQAESTC